MKASQFKTCNPWRYHDEHFLWLCDFAETKQEGFDYKASTKDKIERLPLDVQVMIGYRV